jgi:hypothetical protein
MKGGPCSAWQCCCDTPPPSPPIITPHLNTSCKLLVIPSGWKKSLAIIAPLRCMSRHTARFAGCLDTSASCCAAVLWWSNTTTYKQSSHKMHAVRIDNGKQQRNVAAGDEGTQGSFTAEALPLLPHKSCAPSTDCNGQG